jgi:aspartate aminotransferase
MSLVNPGDEVILIAPYWMTYRDQIMLAGGAPVIVQTTRAQNYIPAAEQIARAVTSKTKAIILNSPCNPTGAVFDRSVLCSVAEIAEANDIYIISDEIYEKHIYDGAKHFSIASIGPEIAQRTVTIGGVSKTFAMTGWRLGYSASNEALAAAMASIQDQVTSNASSVSQKAALAALAMPHEVVNQMVQEFQQRRDFMLDALAKIPHVEVAKPSGAFYVFADFSNYLSQSMPTDIALASFLLENWNVACVPGSVFMGPGCLRLTYSMSMPDIAKGIERISEGVASLT